MPDAPTVAVVAFAVFTLAAAAQAVTGFGATMLAVPLLALVVDPVTAVVASTTLLLLLSALAGYRERDHVVAPVAGRMVVASLLGLPFGLLVLTRVDNRTLSVLISVGVLLLVLLVALRVRLPGGGRAQWGAGVASGVMLAATGMNGPPVVLVLQAHGLAARTFRATVQAIFTGQCLAAVVGFALVGRLDAPVALVVLAGAAAMPAGWWVGDLLFRRMDEALFRIVVLVVLTITAVVGLVGALG